ncbi:MAG: HNH endonuclease signature motif containing protein, partial [Candidatus Peregrinibacteria bacterium]|nr:HNH endonuclease signature motif containing protein [Candidatus Peregrinibacteria bacterium]
KGEVRNIPVESALGQTVGSLDANRKLENEPFQKSCTSTSQSPENRISKSIYMKLNVKTIERLKKIKGKREWDDLLNDMLDSVEANQASEGQKPAQVNTGKRYIPAKIKRYVVAKTSGLCAYPGCSKPYEILHHISRFALDATHDPDTLVPLCKSHERLAHAGLIENEKMAPIENEPKDLKVNWSVLFEPDTKRQKYEIDEKVSRFYMCK